MASLRSGLKPVKEGVLGFFLGIANALFKIPASRPDPESVYKVLLVHAETDSLGDTVISTAALKPLHDAFPKARISVLVMKGAVPVYENNPLVNEVIVFPGEEGVISQNIAAFRGAALLRRKDFDVVVLKEHALRFIVMAWLARIPFRAGVDLNGRGFLLNAKAPLPAPMLRDKHEAEYLLDAVRALGVAVNEEEQLLNVWPSAMDRQHAKTSIEGLPHPLICLNVFTRGKLRAWPVASWMEVCEELKHKKYGVIWISSPENVRQVEEVSRLSGAPMFISKTPGIAAALLDECDVFASADGGLVHLASATNASVVGLYCHSSPLRWGPFTTRPHEAIVSPGCVPCMDLGNYSTEVCAVGDDKGMMRIKAWDVLNTIERVLKATKEPITPEEKTEKTAKTKVKVKPERKGK
ncbi:MAG TPA: glycosyltransferase family 9 protein [Candidatus Norongarragalinales archaeon]|jgi:ADP-heptose:LPS heptosyltransferase|nr:glycosyltransferase family 9 protein [Candidatus Norongarragalinales archaeon]